MMPRTMISATSCWIFIFFIKLKGLLGNRKIWGVFFAIKEYFLFRKIDNDRLLSLIFLFDNINISSEIFCGIFKRCEKDTGWEYFNIFTVKLVPPLSIWHWYLKGKAIKSMSFEYIFSRKFHRIRICFSNEDSLERREFNSVVSILDSGVNIIESNRQEGGDIFKILFYEFFLNENLHFRCHGGASR